MSVGTSSEIRVKRERNAGSVSEENGAIGVYRMERRQPVSLENWIVIGVYKNFTAFQHKINGVRALSSLIHVKEDHLPPHWEWLISFSIMGKKRVPKNMVKWCLEQFGSEDFEEDNHEPGIVREFFLAVDPELRVPCPCKDEILIRDGDYEYSVKKGE